MGSVFNFDNNDSIEPSKKGREVVEIRLADIKNIQNEYAECIAQLEIEERLLEKVLDKWGNDAAKMDMLAEQIIKFTT